MAKRKKKKTKTKAKRKTKRKTTTKKRKAVKRRKVVAKRGPARKKQKRSAARRKEANMNWPEVRASRLRKSRGREDRIVRDFDRAVNITPQALETWLGKSESREVGTPRSTNASESAGHWSGRRIIEIKRKKADDYTAEDYAHMRKVVAYVKRHSAQRPDGDVKETPWRYSLMNWGHDPLK